MRKILLLCFSCLVAYHASAQGRVVSGKVTSAEDGTGMPGVNVLVKGTSIGTVTDGDGSYSLSLAEPAGMLVFTFIGFVTQEVDIGTKTTIDINLSPDVTQLSEVVVTALGVEKDSRSLGYAVSKVNSTDITQGRTTSLLSSLQGKVAGLQVTGSSGAPGSSSKVIIRGFTSLSGGNNPLYIVDGIPVNNSFTGTDPDDALNGASDFGSRINDVNPEDIESISILKGAAATSLYGSRAAAGVIIITTKKGKDAAARGKKAEVTFATSTVFENVLKLPTWQNERGQGFFGSTPRFLNENTSWGSKYDGELHAWGRVVNNQQRLKPYVGLNDNVKEFFETGRTISNSLALQGGNETANYYISYSNVNADGIMPTDVDSYKRNTLSVRGSTMLSNRFSSSASINYARSNFSYVPTGQGGTVYNQILQTPRDISLLELQDLDNQFNDLQGFYSEYTYNPWFVLKEFGSKSTIDRIYGSAEIGYKVNDWIDVLGRLGSDVSTTDWEQWVPKLTITGPNAGNSNPGRYSTTSIYNREFNSDLIVNMNKDVNENINISGLAGFNVNQRQGKNLISQINDLVIPEFYNLANTSNTPATVTTEFLRRLYGVYAQATTSYKNYLFLTVAGRNDWSSTLPANNRSFFYPSVNLAMDITSALGTESNILSYAKARASWAKAGKDAGVYLVNSVFVQGAVNDGFVNGNTPVAQAIPAFEKGNRIGNQNLQPEISTEIELGLDLKFFSNRVGLDLTLYNRDIDDNILEVPIAASSGYTTQLLNIAKLSNKGIELLLTATPLQISNFRWDVSLNFAKNISEIKDLGGPDQIELGGLAGNELIARVGGPAFEILGSVPLRDPQGRLVVDGAGSPRPNPNKQVIANTNYRWLGGITNKFSYKGLTLSGTFDVRNGGYLYSRTATLVYFSGTTPATLYNDRRPFIVPNSVVEVLDGNGEPTGEYTENTTPILDSNGQLQNFWSNGGFDRDRTFFVSKSFVKLREVVLSYSLPKSFLSKTPFGAIDVSVIGRNLFLWVPSENVFLDPEQTTFGTDFQSEFGEFGSSPTTRSYGVNIRLTF